MTATSSETGPLWCESFDADLLRVVPGAVEALGTTADVELFTYNRHPTNGKINCPCGWWTDHGLTSFFWTRPGYPPDACYYRGDAEMVACTFLEVVRDEWVHNNVVVVNRKRIWTPPARLMERLMFDLRGWTVLPDEIRESIHAEVLESLRAAAECLQAVIPMNPYVPAEDDYDEAEPF